MKMKLLYRKYKNIFGYMRYIGLKLSFKYYVYAPIWEFFYNVKWFGIMGMLAYWKTVHHNTTAGGHNFLSFKKDSSTSFSGTWKDWKNYQSWKYK